MRAPLFLAVLTFAAYSNSFRGGFTIDSRQAILSDSRVHAATAENLSLIVNHSYWWPYDESGLYRPLATLSYLYNYAVLGNADRPFGYHCLNFLLHLANVLLVYALARRYTRYAVWLAAVWAVHPVLTESVANVAGRPGLLAALGVLGALWFFVAKPRGWIAGLLAATAIGVFSKESAVVLPALILLIERSRRALVACAVAVVPIALMLWQRSNVMAEALPRYVPFPDNPLVGASFLQAKATALAVLGRYVWLLVWPARLSADYSYAQIVPGDRMEWLAWLTLAAAIAMAWRWSWRAIAWAAICMLPVANLLFPVGTIMAERFLYLPSIVFAAAVASAARWRAGRVVLCLAIAVLAARTWARNPDWRDDRAMAESLVRTAPNSYKSHRLLAWELFQAHENTDRVLREADASVAPLAPLADSQNNADAWRLAGLYYNAAGRYDRSAKLLERCLLVVRADRERAPGAVYAGTADIFRMLAADYLAAGRRDDAAVALMRAQFQTGDLAFRHQLLELYRGIDCAVVSGPAGPAINPQCPPVHRHLCAALEAQGKTAEMGTYGCR